MAFSLTCPCYTPRKPVPRPRYLHRHRAHYPHSYHPSRPRTPPCYLPPPLPDYPNIPFIFPPVQFPTPPVQPFFAGPSPAFPQDSGFDPPEFLPRQQALPPPAQQFFFSPPISPQPQPVLVPHSPRPPQLLAAAAPLIVAPVIIAPPNPPPPVLVFPRPLRLPHPPVPLVKRNITQKQTQRQTQGIKLWGINVLVNCNIRQVGAAQSQSQGSSGRGSFQRSEHLESTIQNVIRSLFRNDIFSRDDDIRLGGVRNLSSLSEDRRIEELMVEDMIRRVNLGVQLANSIVSPAMVYGEVHPKISDYGTDRGQYPRDFEKPRRVEWFLVLDSGTLDRICAAYGLPTGGFNNSFGSLLRDRFSSNWATSYSFEGARDSKLLTLFQYLGVYVGDNFRPDRVSEALRGNRLGGLGGLGGLGNQRGIAWIP